ncbi:hypothetical protein G3257_17850 [Janthinobacterium lividum]|uniref:hypothetical protein n=1 Tax=Janthinobacterium lividum TaxID=29581 RepID=UPI0015950024|nr:hypothetical protein [Janthinobacterium lividum]QKY03933.1 hypothetical protein G3257_17850 [Janthinobacterium lividum]
MPVQKANMQHVALFIALAGLQNEFHLIDIEWVGLELADALVARQQLAQLDAVEGVGLQVALGHAQFDGVAHRRQYQLDGLALAVQAHDPLA